MIASIPFPMPGLHPPPLSGFHKKTLICRLQAAQTPCFCLEPSMLVLIFSPWKQGWHTSQQFLQCLTSHWPGQRKTMAPQSASHSHTSWKEMKRSLAFTKNKRLSYYSRVRLRVGQELTVTKEIWLTQTVAPWPCYSVPILKHTACV